MAAYMRKTGILPVCTNNEARAYFAGKGLTYADVTEGDILTLVMLLNKHIKKAKDIRPLTDKVSAVPPEVETYDIEIVYYTTPESEAEVIANVEGTGGAIDRYNEWQVAALGRDINPDQLRKRILSPSWGENLTGAFRVDVVKPAYKALDDTQVAKFSGHLTVSHKVESEVV